MRVFRHYVSPLKVAILLVDAIVLLAVCYAAVVLRHYIAGLDAAPRLAWVLPSLAVTGTLVPALIALGGYENESFRDLRAFIIRLSLAIAVSFTGLAAFLYFSKAISIWPSSLVLAGLLLGPSLVLVRKVLIYLIGMKALSRRMVILGGGKPAAKVIAQLSEQETAGIDVRAIVSLTVMDEEAVPEPGDICHEASLEDALEKHGADLLLVTQSHDLPFDDLIKVRLKGIEIINLSMFFEQVRKRVSLDHMQPDWFLYSDGFKSVELVDRWVKRLLDICMSMLFIAALCWLMLLVAFWVCLTSKGPAIFRQQRVGLGGKPFTVLKFRSMVVDAEQKSGAVYATANDPRITPFGRFLRRTRIDELPQLFNILAGQMSFVGPRPERPEFVDKLSAEIPFYNERHSVKPGLTGWAQIQFSYAASAQESRHKLEFDLYYIRHASLFLDLMIILQTARVVFFPKGVR